LADELAKLPDDNYEALVSEAAEKYAMKASDFVMRMFESVQTVLMGVALFTLEQETFDMDTPIDSIRVQLYDLLDQELERVKLCLDQAIARRLEIFFRFRGSVLNSKGEKADEPIGDTHFAGYVCRHDYYFGSERMYEQEAGTASRGE